MGAEITQFLQDNLVSILLPVISALAAWFFSRNRERSEITKNYAESERIEAERQKTVAETESIATETANKVLLMYAQLDSQRKHEYDVLKAKVTTLETNQKKTANMLEIYIEVVTYLLQEMEKYNPEVAIAARKKLKEGLEENG